mgnify:CR=1 FL=1
MARKRVESWIVTDDFWQRVEPLIPARSRPPDKVFTRKPGAGRPAKPARQVFEAVMYVLRTGCQWKAGVFEAIWKAGLAEYDQMEGIGWRWQSVDGAMFKAPLAQEAVGRNPTDRGKKGKQEASAGGRTWRPVVAHRDRGQHS